MKRATEVLVTSILRMALELTLGFLTPKVWR